MWFCSGRVSPCQLLGSVNVIFLAVCLFAPERFVRICDFVHSQYTGQYWYINKPSLKLFKLNTVWGYAYYLFSIDHYSIHSTPGWLILCVIMTTAHPGSEPEICIWTKGCLTISRCVSSQKAGTRTSSQRLYAWCTLWLCVKLLCDDIQGCIMVYKCCEGALFFWYWKWLCNVPTVKI